MDHFRISQIWAEMSVRGTAFYKVRYDRIVPCKAWWTPNQPEPSLHRYPSAAVVTQSMELLNEAGQAELGHLYQWPNQASVNGFWSDMNLAWHTHGEDE